ncbi:MAG TPA: glycosyltransferase [Bacteroidota bacterium]|nr:glycosyltransferase [Bacteroidota bacterium]
MNVYAASYQAVSILQGGPNTQVRNTMKYLERHGVRGRLFDPWARFNKNECDLFHVFAANIGTYHLAREVHTLGVPLVVSPIIYSLHSTAFVRRVLSATHLIQKVGKGIWSDYGFAAQICSWARMVLPNTQAEADLVSDGLGVPRSKIRVIPNGVDERFYTADPSLFKRTYGLEQFILNVGHIGHERKNVLALIRALGQIDHPSVIVGRIIPGPYGDACVKEAVKHKQILLLHSLDSSSDMLASAYAACDVFVLPSLFETPGIAALEAGLAGAKVVITPHGGSKEYFGTMATYVNPLSVDSIRDGIVTTLHARRNPGLREHIRKEFLWQGVAKKTAAAYRELLGEE